MNEDKGVGLSPLAVFMFILSVLYGLIVRLRNNLYSWGVIKSKQLPCTVISIGNLTVGGTGKTPMTIHVARVLKQWGYNIAIISRGYRGSAEKTGAIISDGNSLLLGVDAGGDEPI
ncbi:MAG: tetraacyldisaccharide 4'-kinase, partial [Desulfobacterales bacterium]|nr:tetraacyldisaccharide 4'-kinase [Desulfobacterales bacterium]